MTIELDEQESGTNGCTGCFKEVLIEMGLHGPSDGGLGNRGLPVDEDSYVFALQFDECIDTTCQHYLVTVNPLLRFHKRRLERGSPQLETLEVALFLAAHDWQFPIDLLMDRIMNTRAQRRLALEDEGVNIAEVDEWLENI